MEPQSDPIKVVSLLAKIITILLAFCKKWLHFQSVHTGGMHVEVNKLRKWQAVCFVQLYAHASMDQYSMDIDMSISRP